MSEKSNRGSYVPNPKYEDAFFVNRENETVKWMYYKSGQCCRRSVCDQCGDIRRYPGRGQREM